jgi:hypothetical protein
MIMLKVIIVVTIIVLGSSVGLLAGLYGPRLLAQEPPPQVGHGALQRVEIVQSDKCSATLRIYRTSTDWHEASIALPPGQCNKATGEELADQATTFLQDALDKCQELSTLPSDDPDKTTDPIVTNPALKSLRWVIKPDGFTYLCSSPVTVLVTWDGTQYNLEWRSTNAG